MRLCLARRDVLHEQRLYDELAANPWTCRSDDIHGGELRFVVSEEASVQDGVTVEQRGPSSAFCSSTERVGTKTCSERPISSALLLCHVCGCSAISASILSRLTSLLLQDLCANVYIWRHSR